MADMESIDFPKNFIERVKTLKKDEETLSAAIIRIIDESVEKRGKIDKFEGILNPDEDLLWEEIEKEIYKGRLHSRNENGNPR